MSVGGVVVAVCCLVEAFLAVSDAFSFLAAFGLGLAVSILLFVVSYAQQDFLHLDSTLAIRRSTVERTLAENDHLARAGTQVRIYEFEGYLFFGTAARLKAQIEADLANPATRPRILLLDLSHVPGVDASATHTLHQLAEAAIAQGVEAAICGMTPADAGSDRVLARLRPGALIGEVAFYGGMARSADPVALEAARLMVVSRDALHGVEAAHAGVAGSFAGLAAEIMARRIARSNSLLGALLR